jgi:hypothetical protein
MTATYELPLQRQPLAGLDHLDWLQVDEQIYAARSVEFAHAWEQEFARFLDTHQISWRYKPRTFAVEWDEEGNFVDSFTPDFYLPELNMYIELAGPGCGLSSTKARKVRLLRQQYSPIDIELIYSADFQSIVDKFA